MSTNERCKACSQLRVELHGSVIHVGDSGRSRVKPPWGTLDRKNVVYEEVPCPSIVKDLKLGRKLIDYFRINRRSSGGSVLLTSIVSRVRSV